MTNILQFDIITPALREGTKKVSERNAIANLENDTEKREKGLERRCEEPGNRGASRGEETVRFEELNAGVAGRKRRLWRAEGSKADTTEKD